MDLKKNKSFTNKLKNICSECLASSSSHGYSNIPKSKTTFIKILWLICSVLSTGLCCYMVTQNIMNYFKYDVVTKTRLVHQFSATFPTVTICNMNFFTSNYSVEFSENLDSNEINPFISAYEYYYQIYSEIDDKKYGDSLEKLIADSFFEFIRYNISKFRYWLHPIHGNCYQFNSGYDSNGNELDLQKVTTLDSDRVGGLRLILNLSVPESLKFLNPNKGAYIFIHNKTDPPQAILPVTISTNTETNIGLSRTFYELQPKPYSICDKNTNDPNYFKSKSFRLIHQSGNEYSKDLCLFQCYQNIAIQECGCYERYYVNFLESIPCRNETQISCLFSLLLNNLEKTCNDDECPVECKSMRFDKSISFNHFSGKTYQDLLRKFNGSEKIHLDPNESFDDIAIVNIFYNTVNYIQVDEYPTIEFVNLLSNIGGIGGLFLGLSILSLVEIIELIILCFIEFKNHNKVRQQKK